METKQAGWIAKIDLGRCLAWQGLECPFCYNVCPMQGIGMIWEDWGPIVLEANCDGCGVCMEACSSVNNDPVIRMIKKSWAEKR